MPYYSARWMGWSPRQALDWLRAAWEEPLGPEACADRARTLLLDKAFPLRPHYLCGGAGDSAELVQLAIECDDFNYFFLQWELEQKSPAFSQAMMEIIRKKKP